MTKPIRWLFACCCFTLTAPIFAEDSLFSSLAPHTAYSSGGGISSAQAKPPTPQNAVPDHVSELNILLIEAGFSPRDDGQGGLVIEIAASGISRPARVTMTDDQALQVSMPLLEDARTLSAASLLALLDAQRTATAITVAFDQQSGRMGLESQISRSDLSAMQVRTQLERMIALAESTRAIWQTSHDRDVPATLTAPAAGSLTGRWLATPNTTDAMALQILDNSTFRLVIVRRGQSVRSQGTMRIENGTMTLTGDDGTRLSGKMSLRDGEFELQIGTGTPLLFKRS